MHAVRSVERDCSMCVNNDWRDGRIFRCGGRGEARCEHLQRPEKGSEGFCVHRIKTNQ